MGRERTGKRQYFLLCIACLIIFSLSGCNALKDLSRVPDREAAEMSRKAAMHFQRAREFTANGYFEEALRENEAVLSMTIKAPFADEALFNMGLIHLHYSNSKRDNKAALDIFRRLTRDYPQGAFAEQARIWTDTIETVEKLTKRADEKRAVADSLARFNRLLSQGDYEGALRESNRVLSIAGKSTPADEALFNAGLVYADYRNPKKDFKRAIGFFERIVKEFPQSALVQESEIWLRVLRVIERSKQVDIEIEEMKKEMSK